jgi:hypothetical protein
MCTVPSAQRTRGRTIRGPTRKGRASSRSGILRGRRCRRFRRRPVQHQEVIATGSSASAHTISPPILSRTRVESIRFGRIFVAILLRAAIVASDGFSLLQIAGPGNQVYAVSILFTLRQKLGRRTPRNPAISGDKRDDMLSCIASVDGDTAFADNHVYFDEFDELLAFGKFIS